MSEILITGPTAHLGSIVINHLLQHSKSRADRCLGQRHQQSLRIAGKRN
ncbi:hypothetical protein GGR06_003623 [Bacteroides reticulotermitis]|uniref:Uncharacterized protein n=1 Tax=Bacteroides reticulotermitis TaxID=1133319 RepID=A0A840D457_9BACE|nr:hypothetical protein [Bacteroides reticulotermitis]